MTKLKKANMEVATLVAATAKQRAPVGTRSKKRRLSETVRPFASQTVARIRVGGKAIPYANPIHWGWPDRGIKPNRFVSDAASDTEMRWIKIYGQHMEKIVNTIKGE